MLFSNWHVENLLWGLSKCCALQELVHSRGQDLLRDLYEKQTFHLKTSLVAAWQHQCSLWVPLGLSAFVADGLVSIGAFFKQTLNILMILMSMVYPFLKNLLLAPLYVEILLPLFSIGKLESVLRVSACGLHLSPKQPQSTFHSFPAKRATEAESGFQSSKRPYCVLSPRQSWGERNKYIARRLLWKNKEHQHPHLEGLVSRSLSELRAFIMVQRREKWSAESVASPQLGSNVLQTWGISVSRLILIHGLHNGYEFTHPPLRSPQAYMFTWRESIRAGKPNN